MTTAVVSSVVKSNRRGWLCRRVRLTNKIAAVVPKPASEATSADNHPYVRGSISRATGHEGPKRIAAQIKNQLRTKPKLTVNESVVGPARRPRNARH